MGRHSSRSERKLHDEIEDPKPPAVRRTVSPSFIHNGGGAAPLSPARRPRNTPAANTRTPSTRSTTTRSSRTSVSKLALEEMDDVEDDRPVKPPSRTRSSNPASRGRQEQYPASQHSQQLRAPSAAQRPPPPPPPPPPAPQSAALGGNSYDSLAAMHNSTVAFSQQEKSDGATPNNTASAYNSSLSSLREGARHDSMVSSNDGSAMSIGGATTSTLDLVLAKRYAAYGEQPGTSTTPAQPLMAPSMGRGSRYSDHLIEVERGVLLDDDVAQVLVNEKPQQYQQHSSLAPQNSQRRLHNSSTSMDKSQMRTSVRGQVNDPRLSLIDDSSHNDSVSTMMPEPPSLNKDGNYSQPGAFRMRSGEYARSTDADSLQSSIHTLQTFTTTTLDGVKTNKPLEQQHPPLIQASLVSDPVPHDEDDDDDNYNCPAPPVLPNYEVSMGDLTHMTHMTAGTTTTGTVIVEAHPLDESHTIRVFFRSRKVRMVMCMLSTLFLVLALGTIYAVTGFVFDNKNADESSAAEDTFLPTSAPTTPGDLELEYFVQVALPDHTRQALRSENSAQSKALAWLRNNTDLESYPLSRRLQRFSLATFYYSTGGDRRWVDDSRWLSDDDECTWYSRSNEPFICSEGEYEIWSIAKNDMRGILPKEISMLSSLEILEMPVNIITGSLPSTIGEMTTLREIHLFDNYIVLNIPTEIGLLVDLEILDVAFNFMAGFLPDELSQLTNLIELHLDRNFFVGTLPTKWGQFSRIESFNVYGNTLSGIIPTEYGNLSNLREIHLERNFFSGSIPTEIGLWSKVDVLTFGNNTLTGSIPTEIGNCQQLTFLDFFLNNLAGPVPSEIGRLTNMEKLYLDGNEITGTIPTEIGNLQKSLRRWWGFENDLTGALPTEIGLLTLMTDWDISLNKLTGPLPTEIGRMTNMQILYLEKNDFNGQIPSELGNLSQLTRLALHYNDFTGEMPEEICALVENSGPLVRANLTVNCLMVLCDCCNCDDSS